MTKTKRKCFSRRLAVFLDNLFQPGDGGIHPGEEWLEGASHEVVEFFKLNGYRRTRAGRRG